MCQRTLNRFDRLGNVNSVLDNIMISCASIHSIAAETVSPTAKIGADRPASLRPQLLNRHENCFLEEPLQRPRLLSAPLPVTIGTCSIL